MLADVIRRSERQVTNLNSIAEQQIRYFQNINNDSSMTAYYSKIAAQNTSLTNWLAYRYTITK
ncbi:MAG: hypothetical protein IKP82_03990 [Oscillospiraceae bacterium]|nr:hypothetical protein [Oscillospiraceae bacterium]